MNGWDVPVPRHLTLISYFIYLLIPDKSNAVRTRNRIILSDL